MCKLLSCVLQCDVYTVTHIHKSGHCNEVRPPLARQEGRNKRGLCGVQRTVFSVQCVACSVQCSVYSVQCKVCIVSVQYAVCSV